MMRVVTKVEHQILTSYVYVSDSVLDPCDVYCSLASDVSNVLSVAALAVTALVPSTEV